MAITFGKRVYESLNKQISEEFSSSYLYLAMSCVLKDMGLSGCASRLLRCSKEKSKNATEIIEHMQMRAGKIKLSALPAPKCDWRAPLHIFEEMFRNEQKNTIAVHAIYELALAEKDYQSQCFMPPLVTRQTEAEVSASLLLEKLRKMQSSDLGVFMFDAELADKS
ncbi:MAG: ferritin [Holosporaceae bacterium]|nr:ferritin [Holosporaceae bacterium]